MNFIQLNVYPYTFLLMYLFNMKCIFWFSENLPNIISIICLNCLDIIKYFSYVPLIYFPQFLKPLTAKYFMYKSRHIESLWQVEFKDIHFGSGEKLINA